MSYPDDCKSRKGIQCTLMDMSCAMLHTRMSGTVWAKEHDGKCPFYEVKK